jgi:phosphomannomutase
MPTESALDLSVGLRVSFVGGEIVHLRPSGNAPECRCYAEADSPARAEALVAQHLARLADRLRGG